MNVEALDHVNIITDRLDETAEFYARLLGLERRDQRGDPRHPARVRMERCGGIGIGLEAISSRSLIAISISSRAATLRSSCTASIRRSRALPSLRLFVHSAWDARQLSVASFSLCSTSSIDPFLLQ